MLHSFFSDISGSLVGISDFSEDIVLETGSDSGSILHTMVAKATRTLIIFTNPRQQQFLHPSIEKSRVVAILYSRDSNYKAYNYYKVAGGNLLNKYFCYIRKRNVVE